MTNDKAKLHDLRQNYQRDQLDESTASESPFEQFEQWFSDAMQADLLEPNAMIAATVDENHCPSMRTVLLKEYDQQGFVFYTNYGSQKAKHLEQNPNIALQFLWLPLERQVSIVGRAEKLSRAESLNYFLSRPKGSQLGAWVSHQSEVISGKQLLLAQFEKMKDKFKSGKIPLPDFWGGYRVVPEKFEFWQGGENRLHDRLSYQRSAEDPTQWVRRRLSP